MRIVHARKSATADACYSSKVVLNDEIPFHEAVTQTHVLAIAEYLLPQRFNELSTPYPEFDGKPIWGIDKIIVENGLTMNLRGYPVENSGNVGAGIVMVGTGRAFIGSSYAKVAIAARGQCLTKFFIFG